MFRTVPHGTHRAPGRAEIDYRALAAPVGRRVGGAAVIGAVSATAVITGTASAQAQAPAPATVGTVRGTVPTIAPATQNDYAGVKLRLGARGAAVTFLQSQLNDHGASLVEDGVFGSATLRAVKNQQASARIAVDGVVGPNTWASLVGTAPVESAPQTSTSQPKLRRGDRGGAVSDLQTQLNASGASIAVDGVFGSGTLGAVRALQSAAGIAVDGVVGPNTWSALAGSATIGSSTPVQEADSTSQPKLRRGDRGGAVSDLQTQLNASGASIAVDGVFGSGTLGAVRALQSAAGIAVDGVVGPNTWSALASDVRISADAPSRSEDREEPASDGQASTGASIDAQAIIAAARSQTGAPYSWGGESPSTGFDCSGLIHYAYNQAGVDLPRKSAKGYVFMGRIISQSEAQPGDIVAFTGNDYGHAGIYVGNGTIIDASGSRQQVVERSIWNAPHVFVTFR